MDYTENNVNNKVYLSGVLVNDPIYSHEIYGEGFYEAKLRVPRLSDNYDELPVTISERLLTENVIKADTKITVTGQFRSYNKLIDGKSRLMLTVFVRDILEDDPEANPNQIELVGYVCKPPVYRTTPFKREICDILLAVNRAYNKSDYIPCIAWGRNARFIGNITVGQKIRLSGRVQSREYQKKLSETEIETRQAYEISINNFALESGPIRQSKPSFEQELSRAFAMERE